MNSDSTDVSVIGAGAAGLFAGIFAAREGAKCVLIERAKRIGAKILISGGGRCNVTHDVVDASSFYGANRNQIAKVLRSFTVDETVQFFRELGVPLKREEAGKLFPVSDQARDIVNALVSAAHDAGARIELSQKVSAVTKSGDVFRMHSEEREWTARAVVLAAGGRSVPKTGSDGNGYDLARQLGHTVSSTFPALVPLLLPVGHWARSLSGLTLNARLTLQSASGKRIHSDEGSLLFTHFGMSGPLVLDVSRHWIDARKSDASVSVVISFAGEASELERRALDAPAGTTTSSFVRSFVPERLASSLLAHEARVAPEKKLSQCTREERRAIIQALTALPLPVSGDRGFDFAEVTAGGIPLSEVNVATMESRIVPGLYLCGEVLDVDGRIGGYNFQWAWASGRLAGMNAAAPRR